MTSRETSKTIKYEKFCDDTGKIYNVRHTRIVLINTNIFLSGRRSSKSFVDQYDLEDGTEMSCVDQNTLRSGNGALVLRRIEPI